MELITRPSDPKGLIRHPLDPLYLEKAGIIDPEASLHEGPKPGESWSQDYRIFFSRGSWGNDHLPGLLRLNAPNGFGGDGRVTLNGSQLMLDGGDDLGAGFKGQPAVERLDFTINYRDSSLVGWTTQQVMRFYGKENTGRDIPGTALKRSCLLADDKIAATVGSKTSVTSLKATGKIYSDWDLLFRCLSFPFSAAADQPCTILEELSAPRVDGLFYYAGTADAPAFGQLHTFVCQAEGIVPVDYWVNASHQLVTAISGSFAEAYIPAELVIPPLSSYLKTEADRPNPLVA